MDIELVGVNRERGDEAFKPSLTCNFLISDGAKNAHAEVIFVDGGFDLIERQGKNGKAAARIALKLLLHHGCNPFDAPLFVRISLQHARHYAAYGDFHSNLPD